MLCGALPGRDAAGSDAIGRRRSAARRPEPGAAAAAGRVRAAPAPPLHRSGGCSEPSRAAAGRARAAPWPPRRRRGPALRCRPVRVRRGVTSTGCAPSSPEVGPVAPSEGCFPPGGARRGEGSPPSRVKASPSAAASAGGGPCVLHAVSLGSEAAGVLWHASRGCPLIGAFSTSYVSFLSPTPFENAPGNPLFNC